MRELLLRLLLNTLSLWVLTQIYAGVFFSAGSGLADYLIAGLIFGLANALLRPVLLLFTFPINVLTLGLFTLVVNAAILWVVSGFTNLETRSFGAAFIGAIILSLISFGLNMLLGSPERERKR